MARDEIKELVAMKRDNAYLLQYANASIATGDLKTAEGTIEDILATEADNIDVLMLKAKVRVLNKKYEEAVETYKEISIYRPEPCAFHDREGQHLPAAIQTAVGGDVFSSAR